MDSSNSLTAVVFDLDGTLVDSAEDLRVASNTLLAELGRPALDLATIKSFIGDGVAKLVSRILEATGGVPAGQEESALLRRFLDIYEADPSRHTRPFPGVVEALKLLRSQGLRLGICTNKPIIATQRLLDDLGLRQLVDAVVGGDSFPSRKPSPEPLLGVLAMLGVPVTRAAMIGDNEHDVAAGRAAGVAKVLIMRYGYSRVPLDQLAHDGVLDRFSDLPAQLQR
ncbi:MAG TPA: phosphoglycolate phosphatase [Gammaproteobacteria bacterium]|nr:phosphoglycolate phosphatase [Gammaproteobacteria bacterium]